MATHNIIKTMPESFPPTPTHPRFVDLAGQRFGRITVKGYSHQFRNSFWYVQCDCGTCKVVNSTSLIKGLTRSCGCYNREALAKNKATHGHSRNCQTTPEFEAFYHAKSRCQNPRNKSYADYGGRGIEFRFESLEQFVTTIGLRPSASYSLDRINVNGHYEPGNVRWATRREQGLNTRQARMLTINGITQNLSLWAEQSGIGDAAIRGRLKRGWCDNCSVMVPVSGGSCQHIKS